MAPLSGLSIDGIILLPMQPRIVGLFTGMIRAAHIAGRTSFAYISPCGEISEDVNALIFERQNSGHESGTNQFELQVACRSPIAAHQTFAHGSESTVDTPFPIRAWWSRMGHSSQLQFCPPCPDFALYLMQA